MHKRVASMFAKGFDILEAGVNPKLSPDSIGRFKLKHTKCRSSCVKFMSPALARHSRGEQSLPASSGAHAKAIEIPPGPDIFWKVLLFVCVGSLIMSRNATVYKLHQRRPRISMRGVISTIPAGPKRAGLGTHQGPATPEPPPPARAW